MTNRQWPTRQEWEADAEKAVRTACYPRERVPDQVSDWAGDRAQLAHIARDARLGAGRIARLLEQDGTRLADIERELTAVNLLLRFWAPVAERAADAAAHAVEEAVVREVERRKTAEAWSGELRRRAQIDAHSDVTPRTQQRWQDPMQAPPSDA